MSEVQKRFSRGEFLALVSSLILVWAVQNLEWFSGYRGIDWLMNPALNVPDTLTGVMTTGGVVTLIFVVLAGWLGVAFSLLGLIFPTTRQMTAFILVVTGLMGLLFFTVFVYNTIESAIEINGIWQVVGWLTQSVDTFTTMQFGFWLALAACFGLIGQFFIPRSQVITSVTEEHYVNVGLRSIVIALALAFALFPVLFILSSSINPTGQLSTTGLIPKGVNSLDDATINYRALLFSEDSLETFPYWNWLLNSFIVATISTVFSVMTTALAAYSFSRFRFQGRRTLLLGILLIQVFPSLLNMVALFLILQQIGQLADAIPQAMPFLSFMDWTWLGWFGLDSLGGLILVYMGGAMGINTWLMKGFFDTIPRDIDESALVDGATHWQIFWQLIFPLVRPILAVVAILTFVGTFNEFVLARVLLRDKERWTLMVGLYNFINADYNRDWGSFAAGAVVSSVPVVMVYIALQDQIVGGLTSGSVKG